LGVLLLWEGGCGINSGTDDLRDALDRHVEFKVRNCRA
jgi:hypothetical protein